MKHITAVLAETAGASVAPLRAAFGRQSSKSELATAFEQSPKGTFLVDARSLRIVGSNESLRGELGFSETEIRSLSLADLFDCAGDERAHGGPDAQRVGARWRAADTVHARGTGHA